jgi:outer membrane biosynthesis protein TonB
MSVQPPVVEPLEPGEPSNRWPWVALALGVLIVLIAVGFFLFNRARTVNVTVEGTPTVNAVARAVSPVPPTLVPPTLPASATLGATATPVPSPTPLPATPTPPPAPTQPPAPTPPPAPTQAPAPPAAATQPAAAAPAAATQPPAAATQPPAAQPTPPPPTTAPTAAPAAPGPTPFAGQVANPGGLGNTRADLDSAYGAAAGETPEHLVVYRKNNLEYHVGFVPDPNGRDDLIVELPQQNAQPWTLEQAQAEGHKLLPKDAQPPNPPAEANDQFVVERYTSQTLAQALPAQVFTTNKGQPGQFLVVYVKDSPQGRITRIIVGPGNDPQALVNQGR